MEFGERQRRMLRRACAAFLTIFVGAVLTACAAPAPKPSPTPTSTAIFASEEEALAAATDTYAKFNAARDLESSGGDISTAAFTPYVTSEYLREFDQIGRVESNGWHTQGVTTFDTVSLLKHQQEGGLATVSLSLCRDVSGVQILDGAGTEVTPESRDERFPLEVRFVSAAEGSSELLISESGSWSGDDFC